MGQIFLDGYLHLTNRLVHAERGMEWVKIFIFTEQWKDNKVALT